MSWRNKFVNLEVNGYRRANDDNNSIDLAAMRGVLSVSAMAMSFGAIKPNRHGGGDFIVKKYTAMFWHSPYVEMRRWLLYAWYGNRLCPI